MHCLRFLTIWLAAAAAWPALAWSQDHWSSPSTIGSYQSTLPRDWDRAFSGSEPTGVNAGQSFQAVPSQSARFRQDAPDYAPPGVAPNQAPPQPRTENGFYSHPVDGSLSSGCETSSNRNWGIHSDSRSERNANWLVGVNGLVFSRDYEDDLGMSVNALGESLFSTDADLGYFGGVEALIGRRTCQGSGWEARYWGLYPSTATAVLGNLPVTTFTGFADLDYVPSGTTVLDIFNSADAHSVRRTNEFHNVEFNLLRNAGSYQSYFGRPVNIELLGGFRWFYFDEQLGYSAFNSAPGLPVQFNRCSSATNSMMGFQLGARTERQLTCRLSLANSIRGGLFNNRIRNYLCAGAVDGILAEINNGPYAGTDFEFSSRKNDIAYLGELDLGFLYQISSCARLSFGYRAIGVAGVALGADQIP
ncbi:MAG TPA: hypothetical protein PKD54_09700, partial [Pirellulaceae bacterium]|nr:hypothetical protein [Pirellulaceae bacterium]